MKITRKNLDKTARAFYIVTRRGRRIEDKNYSTENEARERAETLQVMLKEWDPRDLYSIAIIHTAKPYKVF